MIRSHVYSETSLISSPSCFLSVLFIQPTYTLSKGEENLLIPVHAYPVIDDLHIPPRIDLSAVPLGQRCVYTPYGMCVGIFNGLFFDLPSARGLTCLFVFFHTTNHASIHPLVSNHKKIISSLFFSHLSVVFAMLFLWGAAVPLTLSFRCMLFSPMRPSASIPLQVWIHLTSQMVLNWECSLPFHFSYSSLNCDAFQSLPLW